MSSTMITTDSETGIRPDFLHLLARKALWILWIFALLVGIVGVFQRITQGHLPAGYGSYVPWGLWVALYFHGVGLAAGVFVLGCGGYVLGWQGFASKNVLRMVIILSTACILPAFLGVWFDLGHLDRAHLIFFSPSFTSMMTFNAWLYNAFLLTAAACFFLSFKKESEWLKPLLCLGILFSVLVPSQSGAFFGVVDSKPFWHSPLLPVLFLSSAITAGGALLLSIRWFLAADDPDTGVAVNRLRIVVITGMLFYFSLEFSEFSFSIWNPGSHSPAIELILWGEYWWVFWIVHLFIGGLLALFLLLQKSATAWVWGGFLVAVTFVSGRLNVLVPGQAIGELDGLQEAFQHERLSYLYHATLNEYLIGFFMLATGMAVFYVGRKINDYLVAYMTQKSGGSDHE